MANLRLKKLIVEVVDNQLKENDPPVTQEAYQALLEAGYSASEAKEKIGAIVAEEIYEVMKENKHYDEKKYAEALRSMVQNCIAYEDTHKIYTEWDEWDALVEKGYTAQNKKNTLVMIDYWWQAWEIFQQIVKQAEFKIGISGLMESQDYRYPVDAWLQDMEMELGNVGEHEKRIEFCQKLLEMLDWTFDDNSNFAVAIGEALYAEGKDAEGREWFEDCLKKDRHNANILNAFSWCIQDTEGIEQAYELLRREVIGVACGFENAILFERAKSFARFMELEKDLKWIEAQMDSFHDSIMKAEQYNDWYDDFQMPIQQPIIKEQKIYPNDPCPCGSGKKYKKCCGKR